MLVLWVVCIAFVAGNVERQAFLFQAGQDYSQYWLCYTAVLLLWLLVIPGITGKPRDLLFVAGAAFIFQLVEDWSFWLWSGYLFPQWFPPLWKVRFLDIPLLDFPWFYYLDIAVGVPLLLLWAGQVRKTVLNNSSC